MIQYRGGPGIRFGGAKLFISLILFLPLPVYLFFSESAGVHYGAVLMASKLRIRPTLM